MNKRPLWLPLALLLVLGLAACGGGGGSSEGGDEEGEIEAAITKSVTLDDPSKCTETLTQNFLDQVEESEGQKALEECEESASDASDDPESVSVTNIQIDGSKATADAAFVGSGLDSQVLTIALVKEEGQWKLDELAGFAKLDQEALASFFEKELKASGELSDEQVGCIADGLREASEADVEELLLEGSSQPLAELAEGCE
ncbi:MAG: hypothetical protein U0R71_11615 [Solirubrobacterales bacterium]